MHPLPPGRTLQEDLLVLARDTHNQLVGLIARSGSRRPMPQTLFECLLQVYMNRKEQIARAALACEKPPLARFFEQSLRIKSLHEAKAQKLTQLTKTKKPVAGRPLKVFNDYWNKINASNELEFIGALYVIEHSLKPGYTLDELTPHAKQLSWSGVDEDQQHTYLEALIAEFASISGERIMAGARQGAAFLRGVFSAFDR